MSNLTTVDYESLGFSKLFVHYLAGRKNLGARFPGDPFDLENSLGVADTLARREYPRQELDNRLVDYNQELGAGEATLRNIDALKKPNTFVVCTGQQPAVLTGPLYTIYKAITCLTLARRLTARAGDRTFIPVFWCASEDHDLEEMNHVSFPGPDGEVRRLGLDLVNDGRPAEQVVVDDAVRDLLTSAAEMLPDSEFKDEVLALFEPEPDDTLGSWLNRILLGLFSDDGLVVLEPCLVRDLGRSVIQRELETSSDTSRLLREAGEKLAGMDYPPAFDGRPRVHCFYVGENRRARVQFYADFCILGEDRVDRRELCYHLEEHPERFSPDAALRPVVQGAVLPVAAYVAGPGEVAYHAQLKELFEHFEVPMPIVYPRASVTLVENAVARSMEKHGLAPAQLFAGDEERERLLQGSSGSHALSTSIDRHLEACAEHLEALDSEVAAADPALGRLVRKVHHRVNRDLHHLKRRVTSALDEAEGVGRRQLARLFGSTFPGEQPQERIHNILPYLVKYGPDLPRALLQSLAEDPRQHVVFMLGASGTVGPLEEAEAPRGDAAAEGAGAAEDAGAEAAPEAAATGVGEPADVDVEQGDLFAAAGETADEDDQEQPGG